MEREHNSKSERKRHMIPWISRLAWNVNGVVRMAALVVVVTATNATLAGTISDRELGNSTSVAAAVGSYHASGVSKSTLSGGASDIRAAAQLWGLSTFHATVSSAVMPRETTPASLQVVDSLGAELLELSNNGQDENVRQFVAALGGHGVLADREVGRDLLNDCKTVPEPASIMLLGFGLAAIGVAKFVRP